MKKKNRGIELKKVFSLLGLLLLVLLVTGCNNKYVGYWCKYNETATIVVLLNDDITEEQKNNIEETAKNYENISGVNYYSKDDYKEVADIKDNDIFASFVFTFNSFDSVTTYVEEFKKMPGVKEATQSNAKNNMSLYELKSNGKYSYSNSDEALKKDIEKGKYKIEKGIIRFTPDKDGSDTHLLYTKNNRLCEDTDCNKIYSKGKENCSSLID